MPDTSTGLTDTVAAPVEKIIEVLTDFESFPEWQAAVMECEVLDRDAEGRGSRVRMKVDAKVKKVGYVVRYTYDLPNGLRWDQESGDLSENTGQYTFKDNGDGTTDVTVDIVAEVGFFVPGPMKKLIREQSLKNSMRELKKRVGA
ncbi:MAG: SRPBCC family protein [Jatrophihabitans sp.]|uniref:SRPBCC family protein n=1 Tax=Jatrophihabitans sp. TaxID=1932789 RepID=UPI003F7F6B83